MRDYNQERFVHELEKSAQTLRCGDWEEIEKYMYQYHLLHIKSLRLPSQAEAEACKAVAIEAMKFFIGSPDGTRMLFTNIGCRRLAIWLMCRRSFKELTLAKLSEELESGDVDRLMARFFELNLKENAATGGNGEGGEGSEDTTGNPPEASGAESSGGPSTAP